ncbi:MAG: sel1 repeat family protein [Rhodospirillaceae bacterium]|nr:sel1 repeat family protein [Rhodospirillaceae bacterium]
MAWRIVRGFFALFFFAVLYSQVLNNADQIGRHPELTAATLLGWVLSFYLGYVCLRGAVTGRDIFSKSGFNPFGKWTVRKNHGSNSNNNQLNVKPNDAQVRVEPGIEESNRLVLTISKKSLAIMSIAILIASAISYFTFSNNDNGWDLQKSLNEIRKNVAPTQLQKAENAYFSENYEKALSEFKLLAQEGSTSAHTYLGVMYYFGNGTTKDYSAAIKWWKLAASQGDASAQLNIGLMHYRGEGVSKNYEAAIQWLFLAADQGNPHAQTMMGQMYYNGEAVSKDFNTAFKWYKNAASNGDSTAQNMLGIMYSEGEGVTKDYSSAVKWYELAAEQREAYASYNLSNMYNRGMGAIRDYKKAYLWMSIAASLGHEGAPNNLDFLEGKLSAEEILESQKLAREWMADHDQ